MLLDLSEGGDGDCQSVKEVAEIDITNVCNKFSELSRLEAALYGLTANCDNGNASCPMLSQLQSRPGQ